MERPGAYADTGDVYTLCGVWCVQAVQRKVLDVLNSVGLSDALLRVIDRRQRLDKWITYGGMVRSETRGSTALQPLDPVGLHLIGG